MVELPLALYGLLWALLLFSVGLFSLVAYRFERLFGRARSLVSLLIFSVLGYLFLFVFKSIYAIIFIFLIHFVRGINKPIFKDYINRIISSDIRATVISIRHLIARIFYAIMAPFIGWSADVYSLQVAFLFSAIVFAFFGFLALGFLKYHKNL